MKLAAVNPEIHLDIEQIFTKGVRSTESLMEMICFSFLDYSIHMVSHFLESSFEIRECASNWLLPSDCDLPSSIAAGNGDPKLTQCQGSAQDYKQHSHSLYGSGS